MHLSNPRLQSNPHINLHTIIITVTTMLEVSLSYPHNHNYIEPTLELKLKLEPKPKWTRNNKLFNLHNVNDTGTYQKIAMIYMKGFAMMKNDNDLYERVCNDEERQRWRSPKLKVRRSSATGRMVITNDGVNGGDFWNGFGSALMKVILQPIRVCLNIEVNRRRRVQWEGGWFRLI